MRHCQGFLAAILSAIGAATAQTPKPIICASVLRPTETDSKLTIPLCVEPSRFEAGDSDTTITVYGSHLIDLSKIRWNGQDLVTTLGTDAISKQTILTGVVPAANLKTQGKATVTVFNADPTGSGQESALRAAMNIYERCGVEIGQLDGVIAKSNGRNTTTGLGCQILAEWECVDYVKRYYRDALGIKRTSNWIGDANTYFDSARMDVTNAKGNKTISTNKQLDPYANDGTTSPAVRDIVTWKSGRNGHVAILASLHQDNEPECVGAAASSTACTVTIVQQNVSQSGTGTLKLTVTTDGGGAKHYHLAGGAPGLQGWLRAPDANVWPNGSFDGVKTDGTVFGWAEDPDNATASVFAQIFIDKDAGTSGANPISVRADEFRTGVQNHAFNYSLPNSYRDGKTHVVWIYAIDSTDGTRSFRLPGSGMSYPFPAASAFGTITVNATLDGASWTPAGPPIGTISYTLVGGTLNTSQTTLQTFPGVAFGSYTLTYTGGSPANSTLAGIAPCGLLTRSPTCIATLNANQTLTFTVQFTSNQPPTAGFLMTSGAQSKANGSTALVAVVHTGSTATVQVNGGFPYTGEVGGTVSEWDWTISGPLPETLKGSQSSLQRFWGAGTYTITLAVKDSLGVLSHPVQGTVIVNEVPPVQVTGAMAEARMNHTATLLGNGLVLITGGTTDSGPSQTAELYDPAVGTWRYTKYPMTTPRTNHSATLLQDGTVLIAGGHNNSGDLNSAEIFDLTSETFTVSSAMASAHSAHCAIRLRDTAGSVLILNGPSGVVPEVFNPTTKQWAQKAPVPPGFFGGFTAAALADGRVWVGQSAPDYGVNSVFIFDPAANTWTGPETPLLYGRNSTSAIQLQTGKIWVMGGYWFFPQVTDSPVLNTELYDIAVQPNGQNVPGPSLIGVNGQNVALSGPGGFSMSANMLPDGRVLLAGGGYSGSINACPGAVRGSLTYDPSSNIVADFFPMSMPRYGHTATLLPSGQVLVVGGNTLCIFVQQLTNSAELLTVQ